MNTLAFITWNPPVELFSIGSLHIRFYSVCWIIGLTLAYLIVQHLYRRQGVKQELFEPLFFYCFVGVLVGARLGHCLFYQPEYFLAHPLEMILPFRHTASGWMFTGYEGLASHGGIIGVFIALSFYIHRTKVNTLFVLDCLAVAVPLTGCFIRLGNLMNSEIVGYPTDMPWGFIFIHNGEDFARHPAQLYEALFYFAVFSLQWVLSHRLSRKMGSGFFFGLTLTLAFVFRFFIEFLKERQVDFEESMALDMGQWLSIPFVVAGIIFMVGEPWLKRIFK